MACSGLPDHMVGDTIGPTVMPCLTQVFRVLRILSLVAGITAASSTLARAQPPANALSVASAGPRGEIGSLAEANEIRVVFSEPMVALGRIPAVVTAPFFRISPAVAGTFRWSGTTILIFTPDPKRPLPFATSYEVTIDADGDRRERPAPGRAVHVQLHDADGSVCSARSWSRRGGRADAPIVVLLRFNQRVRAGDVARAPPAANSSRTTGRSRHCQPSRAARLTRCGSAGARAIQRQGRPPRGPSSLRRAQSDSASRTTGTRSDTRHRRTSWCSRAPTPVPSESWVRLVLDERAPVAGRSRRLRARTRRTRSRSSPRSSSTVRLRGGVRARRAESADLRKRGARHRLRPRGHGHATSPRHRRRVPSRNPPRRGRAVRTPRTRAATCPLEDARLRRAAAGTDVRRHGERGSEGGRRADARLHVGRHRRELASAGLHELRRRPRRVGSRRAAPRCRSTRATSSNVQQWAAPIAPGELMPTLVRLQTQLRPDAGRSGTERRLGGDGRSDPVARPRHRERARRPADGPRVGGRP